MSKSKSKSPKGGDYKELGSGTYGCAVQENNKALQCLLEDDSRDAERTASGSLIPRELPEKFSHMETVSKLFKKRQYWEEEIDQFVRIAEIDPQHKWSLPLMATCKTQPLAQKMCRKLPDGALKQGKSYYQIQMPMAGVSLYKRIRDSYKKRRTLPLEDIFLVMKTLLGAIVDMKAAGFAHMDLKSANMLLYEPENQPHQAFVIDYGMSGKIKILRDPQAADVFLSNHYVYWPPELRLYGTILDPENRQLDYRKIMAELVEARYGQPMGMITSAYREIFLINSERAMFPLWKKMISCRDEKELYNLLKEFFRDFDTYAAGMILMELVLGKGVDYMTFEMFKQLNMEPPRSIQIGLTDNLGPIEKVYAVLNMLALSMAHPDPYARMTAEVALQRLVALEKYYQTNVPNVTSASASSTQAPRAPAPSTPPKKRSSSLESPPSTYETPSSGGLNKSVKSKIKSKKPRSLSSIV